jgi:phytoene synthase
MTTTVDTGLRTAYDTCSAITRTAAKNFHYGIRLLPPGKRAALSAVYALARRIDDIGDGDLPIDVKRERLAAMRVMLADPPGTSDDDPVLRAVRDVARSTALPMDAFSDLVDGVESDVLGRRYDDFDALVGYCRQVAGGIGRLCVAVFGARDLPTAFVHADALGVALQQTNILRDIREDLLAGRVYLPSEELQRFGVDLSVDEHGVVRDDDGALAALVRFSAGRARSWYDDGLRVLAHLDRRSAACCSAMAGIYRELLERIAAEPDRVRYGRTSLSGREKAGVAARALVRPRGAAR